VRVAPAGRYVPPYDATAIAKLEAAGALILGKTIGRVRHGLLQRELGVRSRAQPIARTACADLAADQRRSGAGYSVAALGSDTGGSVRQPPVSAECRHYPTTGAVSRYGLTAVREFADHIGPFARSVKDAATLLSVIAGRDLRDARRPRRRCRTIPTARSQLQRSELDCRASI